MTRINRRDFLKLSSLFLVGATTLASGYLYLNDQSQNLVVEQVLIPIKNLSSALEGFKIVQMSDFHLRPFTKPGLVKRAVEIANSLEPDLTVLTGD